MRINLDLSTWTPEQKKARQRQQRKEWGMRNPDKIRAWQRIKDARRKERLALTPKPPKPVLSEEERRARMTVWQRRKRERAKETHPVGYEARRIASKAKASGRLVEEPCALCGSTVDLERHHRDYAEPLDVTWLCRPHHRAVHERLKQRRVEDEVNAVGARLLAATEANKENDLFAGLD